MGYLIIPDANPIKFVKENIAETSGIRLYDNYNYVDTTRIHERALPYSQPWVVGDLANIQIWANDATVQRIEVVNCDNMVLASLVLSNTNGVLLGGVLYDIVQASYTVVDLFGEYFIRIVSDVDVLISEPQIVVKDSRKTVLIEYAHDDNALGCLYKLPAVTVFRQTFYFRVEGNIFDAKPENNTKEYEDQILDFTLLGAKPYIVYSLAIGMNGGVPEWVGEKLNMIRSHRFNFIEDYQFIIFDKIVKKSTYPYSRHGYTVPIRKSETTYQKAFGIAPNRRLCSIPINIVVSNLTFNSFTVGWSDGGFNGLGFLWQLTLNDALISSGTTFEKTLSFSDLLHSTDYVFTVRAKCREGYSSPLTANVTTLANACGLATNFVFMRTGPATVQATWDAAANSTSYDWELRTFQNDIVDAESTQNTFVTLNGATVQPAGTRFNFRIITRCGVNSSLSQQIEITV